MAPEKLSGGCAGSWLGASCSRGWDVAPRDEARRQGPFKVKAEPRPQGSAPGWRDGAEDHQVTGLRRPAPNAPA